MDETVKQCILNSESDIAMMKNQTTGPKIMFSLCSYLQNRCMACEFRFPFMTNDISFAYPLADIPSDISSIV